MTVIKCPGLTVVSLIFMAKPGGDKCLSSQRGNRLSRSLEEASGSLDMMNTWHLQRCSS